MKPTTSDDGKPKQLTVSNPQHKQNVHASSKTMKTQQTSNRVLDLTASSGKTRPKRRSRRLVSYDESDDQSAGTMESNDESPEFGTRRKKGKKTFKRKSNKTSWISETAVNMRYVRHLSSWSNAKTVLVAVCCLLLVVVLKNVLIEIHTHIHVLLPIIFAVLWLTVVTTSINLLLSSFA